LFIALQQQLTGMIKLKYTMLDETQPHMITDSMVYLLYFFLLSCITPKAVISGYFGSQNIPPEIKSRKIIT